MVNKRLRKDLTDTALYFLSDDDYERFVNDLNAPARANPKLAELLSEDYWEWEND